ncbi:prenyltransferase-like protein [Xylariaceae sp. AK1471]|nr:prenyltransferase-like protein [Xylariaceae sp. AK1471]
MATAAAETRNAFEPERFLVDYKKTAEIIGAPYSEDVVRKTLETFPEQFTQGSVSWRATSRANDQLNYRFYVPGNADTIATASAAGYFDADSATARLAASWSSLFDGAPTQWCDFDSDRGLSKTWILLKGLRSVDDILDAEGVPKTVRAHRDTFKRLGLRYCHFVAVDHHSASLNIYFTVPGPIGAAQAAAYTALAGASPPTPEEWADMQTYVPKHRFAFAVTMAHATGQIKRVSIYALNIPREMPLPATVAASDRLRKFFESAPCYDAVQARTVGWSYGKGDSKYVKGEAGYVDDGEVAGRGEGFDDVFDLMPR